MMFSCDADRSYRKQGYTCAMVLVLSKKIGHSHDHHLSLVVRHYAKTKTQISFAVTAKLISAFVFTTRILQSLFFLNPEIQASSHLLWLYRPVCVGPGLKPRRPVFSQRGSFTGFRVISFLYFIFSKQCL